MERKRGSGAVGNLRSNTPAQYREMDDIHEHYHHSQKSLTMGAAMIIRLAVALAMGNPLAGAGFPGMVVGAGLNTFCGEASVCLVENDGNPGRAMEALGERNIGKSMLMSMASAGLIGSGPVTAGLSTSELITAYAKHELLKATVNATLAATMDGQDFRKAMLQGVVMAGINTAAAFGAHQIGDMYKPSDGAGAPSSASSGASSAAVEPISYTTHKMLHTFTGAALGALSAVATGQDVGLSAASGGFGGLVGSVMTEAMIDEKDTFAKAQRITQMSDFLTATIALGIGLDPTMAYLAAHNASEHNELKHHRFYLESVGVIGAESAEAAEAEELFECDDENYTPESRQALKKLSVAYKKLEDLLTQDDEKSTLLKGTWCAELEHARQTIQQIQANPRISEIVKGYAKFCWQGIQEGVRECRQNPVEAAAQAGLMVGEIFVPFAEGGRLLTSAARGGDSAVSDGIAGTTSLALDHTLMAFGQAGYVASVGVKTFSKASKVCRFFADVHKKAVASVMTPATLDKFCLKAYASEVEKVSGIALPAGQRDLLFDALRARPYTKLDKAAYDGHSKLYKQNGVRDRLIEEWQHHTKQIWPKYGADVINPKTGETIAKAGKNYQFHHVIPQQYAGPHVWWNGHPVAVPGHQNALHGKDSTLMRILQTLE